MTYLLRNVGLTVSYYVYFIDTYTISYLHYTYTRHWYLHLIGGKLYIYTGNY